MFTRPSCVICGEIISEEDSNNGYCKCEIDKKDSYLYYRSEQGFITTDVENKSDQIYRRSYMIRVATLFKKLKSNPTKSKKKNLKPKIRHRKPLSKSNSNKAVDFYSSREWLSLRYDVIEKFGRVCSACGKKAKSIHVDHIKPRSIFPELELDINNLQTLCPECNKGKSNRYTTDWRKESKTK